MDWLSATGRAVSTTLNISEACKTVQAFWEFSYVVCFLFAIWIVCILYSFLKAESIF
jgi:hypothetical protein